MSDADGEAIVIDADVDADADADADADDNLQFGQSGSMHLRSELLARDAGSYGAYLRDFRAAHSLQRTGIEPVLSLLEMGSVSRGQTHDAVLHALIDDLLVRIKNAADKGDQDTISRLFDATFVYLTVGQLRPVATAVLEAVDERVVGMDHWQQIVDAGLDNEPYVGLPNSLKVRIWKLHRNAFEYEVECVLRRVAPMNEPECVEDVVDSIGRYGRTRDDAAINTLVSLVKTAADFDAVSTIFQVFLRWCKDEVEETRRVALANVFLDFLTQELYPNKLLLRYPVSGIVTDAIWAARLIRDKAVSGEEDMLSVGEVRTLKSWVCGTGARGRDSVVVFALLFHSSVARDVFTFKLVAELTAAALPAARYEGSAKPQFLRSHSRIPDITLLTIASIRAHDIICSGVAPVETDAEAHFQSFFPCLLDEIVNDKRMMKNHFRVCTRPPSDDLRAAVKTGVLARRTISSYVCTLALGGNYKAGVSRYRLVLDDIVGFVGIGSDPAAEEREHYVALNLIQNICLDVPDM